MAMKVNGHHYWAVIHLTAWYFPDEPTPEESLNAKEFMEKLAQELICNLCRHHFGEYVKNHPPDTSSRSAFFRWTVDAHNFVNRRLKKPEVSYEQASQDVTHLILTGEFPSPNSSSSTADHGQIMLTSGKTKSNNKSVLMIWVFFLLLIVLFILAIMRLSRCRKEYQNFSEDLTTSLRHTNQWIFDQQIH